MRTWLLTVGALAGVALPGIPAAALDLTVGRVVVTQSTQNAGAGVPLVADRRALVRVFLLANADNRVRPRVRVSIQNGRKVHFQALVDAPAGLSGVPTSLAGLGDLSAEAVTPAWSVVIPAAAIKPGNSLMVDVDPDRRVRDSNRGNNTWPAGTSPALAVTVSSPLRLTMVPLHRTLTQTTSAYQPALAERYVEFTRRVHPLPEAIDVATHAPFSTSEDLATQEGWSAALSALEAMRRAERSTGRHYVGLVAPPGAYSGLGYVGGFSVLSVDGPQAVDSGRTSWQSYVLAHELGHNFGRQHAPCGGAGGPDPAYPYPLASIGVPGHDVFTGGAYDPRGVTADLMSYCTRGIWISDFNYYREIEWRNRNVPARASSPATREGLLVWGRIEGDRVILEPAFRVAVAADAPDPAAPLAVEVLGRDGRALVRHGFWPLPLDHQSGLAFAMVVPLPEGEAGEALSGLRLRGEGKLLAESRPVPAPAVRAAVQAARTAGGGLELRWPAAHSPLAVVRDADSGEILTFGRGGRAEIATRPAHLEVTFSDGVDSQTERLEVP